MDLKKTTVWKLCVGKHVHETKTQCVRDKNKSKRTFSLSKIIVNILSPQYQNDTKYI